MKIIDKDETVQELNTGFERWDILYNYGGNDPMWSDGVNLNLVRNHIIAYKKELKKHFQKRSILIFTIGILLLRLMMIIWQILMKSKQLPNR